MQDKYNEIKAIIDLYKSGEKKFSCLEVVLIIVNIFLFGMLIGMLVSPRKNVMIGSNNGNTDGIFYDEDEFEEE